jgi:hypothetical protein
MINLSIVVTARSRSCPALHHRAGQPQPEYHTYPNGFVDVSIGGTRGINLDKSSGYDFARECAPSVVRE